MSRFFDLEGHGAEAIRYEVRRSPRRRTLAIAVHPDSRIVVHAPAICAAGTVSSWVRSRATWIERQLERFRRRSRLAPPVRYVSGEEHRYLGSPYPLRLVPGRPEGVELADGQLVVSLMDGGPDPAAVSALLHAWYREQAAAVFQGILEESHAAFFARRGHHLPVLVVKAMKRRWGSMSTRGRMALSMDLIRTPRRCIELVVTHELCHLEQQNHGAAFYRLLGEAMPDWRDRRADLRAALR